MCVCVCVGGGGDWSQAHNMGHFLARLRGAAIDNPFSQRSPSFACARLVLTGLQSPLGHFEQCAQCRLWNVRESAWNLQTRHFCHQYDQEN